jgi:hypothetical protein
VSAWSLTFELHVFAESKTAAALLRDLPSARHALFVAGVPRRFIGRRYTVDSKVAPVEQERGQPLARFGSSGLAGAVCVDIMDGHVIEFIAERRSEKLFVNTSVEQFTQTVKAMIDRFPYYGQQATDDKIDRVAEELLEIIRTIDSEAAVPNRYWSTFVDDVKMGDLSTEAILAVEE